MTRILCRLSRAAVFVAAFMGVVYALLRGKATVNFDKICPRQGGGPYVTMGKILEERGAEAVKNWDELYAECMDCRKCSLADTRHNVVFGEGARDAEVMFIGEGPGEQEDLTGRPFVGRAGQLLDDMLEMIDLRREKVFIGNMVKCRPPGNRDPLNIEQEACIGYLRNQVALIRPKIIVCLGRIAAIRLMKDDFKITREHGQWMEKAGVWMMAMFHPSALLRDPSKRPESFVDLKTLQAKIREICTHTYND